MEIIRLESYNIPLDRPANNYLIKNEDYNIFIDGGATSDNLAKYSDKIDYVLITHGHWDHTFGITGIKDKQICMNSETYKQLNEGSFKSSALRIAEVFGYNEEDLKIDESIQLFVNKTIEYYDNVSEALKRNHYIPIDECKPITENVVRYIKCPGHSDDHLCYFAEDHFFAGDNILPGGGLTLLDFIKYQESIMKVLSLNDWNYVHPGHGPDVSRNEATQWLIDIIEGKEKKMMQLVSMINLDWIPINSLLPKLYSNITGPLVYIAARSLLGYLISIENMKMIEINRSQKPWMVRRIA